MKRAIHTPRQRILRMTRKPASALDLRVRDAMRSLRIRHPELCTPRRPASPTPQWAALDMELTVSNSNLHPVWAKALGITPQTTSPSTSTATQLSPLAAAIAAMTGHSSPHHGWQATSHPCRPGAPVGIKKQVGPGLWVSTVARPGDTLYPA